ncbi:hypothetical protein BS17DRAFT_155553 [Gyrodon lividus]|nr:hypothetical protein BS17DRAFT_155553 [Gyrodon lividus]
MSQATNYGTTFETASYIGINLEDILYGIELVLYFKTIHILLSHKGKRKKSDIFYAFFSTMMLFLITVWVVTQAMFGENVWVQNGDHAGGPGEYWAAHISDWYMNLGGTAIIVLQLMTDALMIYRCRIVWNSYRIIIVPSILWVATLGLGIMVDWASSSPGNDIFTGLALILGLAYWSISVLLNITVTSIICYRMVWHGMKVKKQLGNKYACTYFDVVSIIVESVLPYTLSGIAFLVSFGLESTTSVTFFSVYVLVMCVSPQILILRVIMGRAWSKETGRPQRTTIKFSPDSTDAACRFVEESAGPVHLQVLSNVYLADSESKV